MINKWLSNNIEKITIICITVSWFLRILLFPDTDPSASKAYLVGSDPYLLLYYIVFIFILNIFLLIFIFYKFKQIFLLVCSMQLFFIAECIIAYFNYFYNIQTVKFHLLYNLINLLFPFTVFMLIVYCLKIYKQFSNLILGLYLFVFIIYLFCILFNIQLDTRLDVLYGHPNHLGNTLSFGILFLSFSVLSLKNKILKYVILIITFVLILGLVATLSRGAWLGLCAGILFGSIIAFIYSSKKTDITKIVIYILIAFAISVIIVNPNRIKERFDMSVNDTKISTMNRITLWKVSLAIIKDHPLTGVGQENFYNALDKNYKTDFLNDESFTTAMNNYLTLACETGIILTLFYIFIIVYTVMLNIKSIIQNKDKKETVSFKPDNKLLSNITKLFCIDTYLYIKIGMLAGVISLLTFGLTTCTLLNVYSNLLIWSSLGYITADYKIKDKN